MFLASAAEAISLDAIPNRLQEKRALLFILPPDKLLALYGCCDVFLSRHRSEGFGGNADFCTGHLAHPVRRWAPAGGAGSRPCR